MSDRVNIHIQVKNTTNLRKHKTNVRRTMIHQPQHHLQGLQVPSLLENVIEKAIRFFEKQARHPDLHLKQMVNNEPRFVDR